MSSRIHQVKINCTLRLPVRLKRVIEQDAKNFHIDQIRIVERNLGEYASLPAAQRQAYMSGSKPRKSYHHETQDQKA